MTRPRRKKRQAAAPDPTPKRPRRRNKTRGKAAPPEAAPAADVSGPTLRSQSQLEIRLGRGARPLTAIEQAARLASARMERRIGRLLSRRVKLKFRP
jgi:hypothetical protein